MYKLERFGDVELPKFNSTENIAPRARRTSVIEVAAGGIYRHQLGKAQPKLTTLKKTAEVVQGLDSANLSYLYGMIGEVAKLWRRDQERDDVQWAWAELSDVESSRTARYSPIAPVDMNFLIMSAWHGHVHEGPWYLWQNKGLDGGYYLDETSNSFDFANQINIALPPGGNATVEDARIIVNATTEIPSLTIQGPGIDISYIAPIPVGNQVTLDCAMRQITRSDGAPIYRYLRLGAGHKQANWLPIRPDGTNLVLNSSGGQGNISFAWSDCWE
jgi:hypothetical protein